MINKESVFQDIITGCLNTTISLHEPQELTDFIAVCLLTTPRNQNRIIKLLKLPNPFFLKYMAVNFYHNNNLIVLRNLSKVYKFKMQIEIRISKMQYYFDITDNALIKMLLDISYFVLHLRTIGIVFMKWDMVFSSLVCRNRTVKYVEGLHYFLTTLPVIIALKECLNIDTYLHIQSTTPLYNSKVISQVFNIVN